MGCLYKWSHYLNLYFPSASNSSDCETMGITVGCCLSDGTSSVGGAESTHAAAQHKQTSFNNISILTTPDLHL